VNREDRIEVMHRRPQAGYYFSTHPHIHVLTFGDFIDIPAMNALASRYGFGTVNVRAVNNAKKALGYLSTYLGKEQPVQRSRDSGGLLRKLCRDVRLDNERQRLLKSEE
jgi:hypothetical protein